MHAKAVYVEQLKHFTSTKNKKERAAMPVKVKIVPSKREQIAVQVRRPLWQQFINY